MQLANLKKSIDQLRDFRDSAKRRLCCSIAVRDVCPLYNTHYHVRVFSFCVSADVYLNLSAYPPINLLAYLYSLSLHNQNVNRPKREPGTPRENKECRTISQILYSLHNFDDRSYIYLQQNLISPSLMYFVPSVRCTQKQKELSLGKIAIVSSSSIRPNFPLRFQIRSSP